MTVAPVEKVLPEQQPQKTRPQPQHQSPPAGRAERHMVSAGWAFSAPSLLVVAGVMVFPIVFSVVMSLSNVNATVSGFHLSGLTFDNYSILFHADRYWHSLYFTVLYTIGTVFAEIIAGMLIALVLERLKSGRGWMMTLLLMPWAIVSVISAELWDYIYNGVYGVLNAALSPLFGHDINVLGTPLGATVGMAVADIWKTTPFVAVIILAGLVMLPGDVMEAGRMDGANGWQIFWHIRFPLMRPTLSIAVMFRILQAFGLFDLPYVLTNGGPGNSTESLALLGYQVLFVDLKFGPGAAVATSTAVIVLIGCLLFLKVFRSQVGQEEI